MLSTLILAAAFQVFEPKFVCVVEASIYTSTYDYGLRAFATSNGRILTTHIEDAHRFWTREQAAEFGKSITGVLKWQGWQYGTSYGTNPKYLWVKPYEKLRTYSVKQIRIL